MAGTDKTRVPATPVATGGGPVVVLVDPQLGENIGMVARAMFNCGLTELRLVRPRDGWPSERAAASASGADDVVDGARVFETTDAAIADLDAVYAATARPRDMTKRVVAPGDAAAEMREFAGQGRNFGVTFGPEAKGLTNDDVALADAVITIELNPAFMSLNLSQAVFCVGYEWFRAQNPTSGSALTMPKETRPATKEELLGLFRHLESELDASGFFRVGEKRPIMERNLRNIFQRAGLTEQEVRTLRGVITSLRSKKGN